MIDFDATGKCSLYLLQWMGWMLDGNGVASIRPCPTSRSSLLKMGVAVPSFSGPPAPTTVDFIGISDVFEGGGESSPGLVTRGIAGGVCKTGEIFATGRSASNLFVSFATCGRGCP